MRTPHLTDPLDEGLAAKLEDEAAAWRKRRGARSGGFSTAGVPVVQIISRSRHDTRADRYKSTDFKPDAPLSLRPSGRRDR
jgi:hypothetical protein